MIPMRDGVKLFTVILSPVDAKTGLPVLIQRTPYGADFPMPDDTTITKRILVLIISWPKKDTFLFSRTSAVNIKVKAPCRFIQPLIHATQKGAVDESTDTWDAVDWLIKNIAE